MIKSTKNATQKENNKANNQLKSIKSKNKRNLKNCTLIANKPEATTLKTTKTFYEPKKKINRKIINYNSLSSQLEIKFKNSPNGMRNHKNKQLLKANKNNCNKLITSNNAFSKRESDSLSKEKHKKFKKYNSNFDKKNISQINNIFKKNILKQTIIIDNEGNNNLNINAQYARQKDYKNILDNQKFEDFNEKIKNINSTIFSDNNETNSLFENSCNYILNKINKEKDPNLIISNKNEEEKRIKEYNKIFNLLNTNIEQFKKMFVNNQNNDMNKTKTEKNKDNKKIIFKKKNYKTSTIPTCRNSNRKNKIIEDREKNYDLNLKKNLSEENMKYNKTNSNNKLLYIDINNEQNILNNINEYYNTSQDNKEIKNNNNSFLESSIDNDFYQSLINQTFLQNISHTSFEINIDDISNDNIERNKNNKISLTENNNYKKDNNFDINNNEIEEIKQKNLGSPILKTRNKPNKNLIEKTDENDKENVFKFDLNIINKNNCLIF